MLCKHLLSKVAVAAYIFVCRGLFLKRFFRIRRAVIRQSETCDIIDQSFMVAIVYVITESVILV